MPVAANLSNGLFGNITGAAPTAPAPQPVAPSQPTPQFIPAGEVQPTSTTPPTAESAQLAVANMFGGLPTLAKIGDPVVSTTSYVTTCDPGSRNWQQYKAAGAIPGGFMLVVEGQMIPLQPLTYFLTQFEQYRTIMDSNGNIIQCTKDMEDRTGNKGEHYHCLLLVIHNGQLIPAKAEMRTTKSSVATEVIREIQETTDPATVGDWIKKSDAHRLAAAFQQPFGRVVGVSMTGAERTSRSSGNPYIPAITSPRPATLDEMKLILKASTDAKFATLYAKVQQEWNERKAFLDRIAR